MTFAETFRRVFNQLENGTGEAFIYYRELLPTATEQEAETLAKEFAAVFERGITEKQSNDRLREHRKHLKEIESRKH